MPSYSTVSFFFFFFFSIIHMTSSAKPKWPQQQKLANFTLLCNPVSGGDGVCQVVFPKGHTAQLFFFMEKKDGLPHFLCICPSLDDGRQQRICMLDRDEVKFPRNIHLKAKFVSLYAKEVNKINTFSPIFSRVENRIKAITYGEGFKDGDKKGSNGYMIWRNQQDGGGCTAMITVPSEAHQVQIALAMLNKNEWKLKSIRMHACPLANKDNNHFGCAQQHIFIINYAQEIVSLEIMRQPSKTSWMLRQGGKIVYLPWHTINTSFQNNDNPTQFIMSSKTETELRQMGANKGHTAHRCSYDSDFLKIQPFAFAAIGTKKDKLPTAVSHRGKIVAAATGVGIAVGALGYALGPRA